MKKIILICTLFFIGLCGFSQDIIMQNGTFTQCGDSFFDSGGSTMTYSNNEDFTLTICPTTNPENVRLDFTAFTTQPTVDVMTIYDGDDDTAPILGMFSGNTSPGIIQASDSNPTGCLTINFVSNGNGNSIGWAADISCVAACQAITSVLDSSTPAVQTSGAIIADVDEVVTFNGSGTFSVDGTGATYTWNFGDGNTATGESVTHAYTNAGLFTVTLTIEDSAGCFNQNDIGVVAQIGSSSPGNPFVEAGDDVDLPCDQACTTLSASFLDIGDTSSYTVSSIPFVPPFPFSGLTNSVNTNVDDRWNNPENLPFDFCFFTDLETQFQVGSNGVVRFDVDAGDTSNDWNPNNNTLPNNTDEALREPNVFSPLHDIDPSVGDGSDEIAWEIIGTAPNRVLAVSFFNVPMWNCNSEIATHMAVFYETTNVIDIYIENAPFCSSWNNNKVVGIQNDAGTEAFVPPGRNTNEGGGWTASEEAWRFTPAGPTIIDFAWLDGDGNVLSTDIDFEVCPTAPSTTYTAQVTYNTCTGIPIVITDDVTVTTNSPFTVDLGPDIEICENLTSMVTLDADVGIATTTFQWTFNGTDLVGETNSTLDVSTPDSGSYSVTVTDTTDNCVSVDEIEVTFIAQDDATFTITPNCNGGGTASITGLAGGTFAFNPVPTDGAVIDSSTGEVTGGVFGTTYTIEYSTSGACPSVNTENLTVSTLDDSSFTVTPTCDGGTVTITGDTGGNFTFNPMPTDGAVIDASTGEVTNGISNTTYTIQYTTSGTCPDASTQDVTVLTADDPSFTVTPTCDGGTATITGDTGGTFAFNPIPTDGAVINSNTGEVTNGTSDATYTLEYTTSGTCTQSLTQDVTVITADDPSFTVAPTCDGGTATITGDIGGTFSLNPMPTDGTVIDASTGEVTGGISGTTYTVEYTTSGTCIESSTQNITVITQDDASFTVTPICDGGTVTITGDMGGTFALNPIPTDGAVIDTATGEVTGGTFGTIYTIEYSTSGTCPNVNTVDLTVLTLDDSSFMVTPTCDGGNVTITGDTGGTFTLNPIPTDGAVIDASTGEITNGTSATTYTIQYTTAGACPDTSTQDVTVITADDPSFTVMPTCDGGTVTITGDTGGTFSLNPIPTDGAVIDSNSGEVTNGTSAVTYTIEYATAGTCPQTLTQDVTVVTEDDASFTVTPTCDGGVATITGLMGGTFTFNPLPIDGALIDASTGEVTNGTPGETYTVEYSVADVCPNSSSVQFSANPLPDDNVVVSDFLECENNTDFLFEFNLESKNDEILNGQDPMEFTVTYHDSQDDADDLADALVSPYENTSNPQPIYVAITNNATGCSVSTLSFNIEVLDGADANDDFYEECDVVGDNDGSTQFNLESRIPNIIGTQDPNDVTVSFHFTEDNAFDDEAPLPFLYENLTNPQIVYARVSNNIRPDECFDIAEVTLQTNPLPIFDLEDEYILCLTSNDEAVVPVPPILDTQLPADEYSFEWSYNGDILTSETESSLIPTQGGTYSVVVTDTSTSTVTMCMNSDSTEVIESGIPDTFDVEVTSQAFTGNNLIIATATGNSTYEYSLDLGPWDLSGEFENVSGGDHTVYVRDINGCGIISRDVTVIDYPKFFTPNGDGNNDTWTIKGIDTQPTAVIYIHDRYGKLLKQLSPTSPGWDGTYNGNRMPSSDYWFTLQYTEPTTDEIKSFSAHFALKR